ncbi:hypothetical protein GCM10009624_19880 [Gordonia sinesedis]
MPTCGWSTVPASDSGAISAIHNRDNEIGRPRDTVAGFAGFAGVIAGSTGSGTVAHYRDGSRATRRAGAESVRSPG